MKIGLLSMQQITNYGSFLQAYGLKSILKGLGNDVEFVNIVPGEQLKQYRIGKLHKVRLMLKRLKVKHPLRQIQCTFRLHKRFNNEFKPELGVQKVKTNTRFDAVVIGSDEVFNVAQTTWFGFSTQLFGEGLNADKVISYAACCGATTILKLKELGLKDEIGYMLKKNFKALSVRDDNSFKLVSGLSGKTVIKNIDPVLLYDFKREIPTKIEHTGTNYMIIYTYPNRMRNRDEINAIKSYARSNKLRIISIGDYFDWVDEIVVPHPFEVLTYFRDARCIVTDTFHGSIMSIKYNKPFATLVREMNSNKLMGLLEQFGLSKQIASKPMDIPTILDTDIDYVPVNALIAEEQTKAIEYLKFNLQ